MATFNKGMKHLQHKIIEDLKEIRKHIYIMKVLLKLYMGKFSGNL